MSTTNENPEQIAAAGAAIADVIEAHEQRLGLTEAEKASLVAEIAERVKCEIAAPADAIAEAVLRRIATKAAIVPRDRVLVVDTARERQRRASAA